MLNPEQQAAVNFNEGQCALISGPGSGKCLGYDTPILMFDGAIKSVQCINQGDLLMGPDSKPRTVLSTSRGIGNLFEIKPVKGNSFVANEDHILVVDIKHHTSINGEHEITVGNFLQKSPFWKHRAKLIRTEVEFSKKDIEEPYFMGLWIGDGTSALDGVEITTGDNDVVDYLIFLSKKYKIPLIEKPNSKNSKIYRFSTGRGKGKKHKRNALLNLLRRYQTSQKQIPVAYKISSISDRLSLLAGLMDSDGHLGNGYFDFIQKNKKIAEDVCWIARSVGLWSAITPKKCSCQTGAEDIYWRVSICGNIDKIPTKIKRKQAEKRKQIKNVLRTGFSVTAKNAGEYFGFTLDGDGRFLLGDFTVTHNTTVLTGRYTRLVQEGNFPHDILSVTFTKEAAESMMRRAHATKEQFSTFHSLGYRIIQRERGEQPLEPELRHRLLAKLSKKWKREYRDIAQFISECRRGGISVKNALREKDYIMARAFEEYENERSAGGWVDFDCMLADAVDLLRDAEIRKKWQFKWIMADEMQDTEPCQLEMLKLLSEKHGNVFCVGDENQSIYQFRGSIAKFADAMKKIWPHTQVLNLSTNYRSHGKIVNFIKKKAAHQNAVIETMTAARKDEGADIEYRQFLSEFDEAEDTIASILENGNLSESAVLARTNRLLMPFEILCQKHNIPYKLLGKSGFWKQNEVQKAIKLLSNYAGLSTHLAVNMVFPKLESHYKVDDATREDNEALENLQSLKSIVQKFDSLTDFLGYANRVTHAKPAAKGIIISTVHQAKGTEYKNVYIAGCRTGMMPHDKGEPFEERRIFFVACSRAKDYLRLSFVGAPSLFIRPELTPEILSQLETERTKVRKIKKQDVVKM